jgi:protease-4
MKKRTAWILVAGVAAVSLGAAVVGGLALVLRGGLGPGTFSGRNYLYVGIDGQIPEEPPPSELGSLFEKRPSTLRVIVESLDRAATDPKITAVVLRVGSLPGSGWGQVQELRDALTRFRRSGKPAYAHLEFCGNKEYYLATACSKIYALPTGLLAITALASEVTFFRGTLDKLGVTAQFEGVGKYKNAPNQFTETGFTPPHREQMDALLDSFNEEFIGGIAKGRGKTPEEVRRLVDQGPYDGRSALKAGLVDELKYQDEIEATFKEAARLTPSRYVKSRRGFGFSSRPKVALIYAVGEIASGTSQNSPIGGSVAGSDTVAAAIRDARNDDSVKAIILRVDSPGGSGTASDVIWRETQLARKSKPVVTSMGDLAASGGYYIAMGSDAIVADPGTITGSIGVFAGKFSLAGLYEKVGLSEEILTRGENGDLFSEYRPWTSEERAKIRDLMVSFYNDFVAKAAEGRKKSVEEVGGLAQGRIWSGAEAKKNGLVDRLGGLDVAVQLAKEKARLSGEVELVVLPERKGLLETLMEREEESAVETRLPREVRAIFKWVRLLAQTGPVARLPFELRIR